MIARATHGGKREGAGRKPSGKRRDPAHRRRPELSAEHPVHVVLRVRQYAPRLRVGRIYHVLRAVLKRYLGLPDFRVVHISIQHNHLHLIVEAADRLTLTRRMQSFAINAARAINGAYRNRGKVFAFRYHATQIRDPRQARCALSYVLNNWRHHQEDNASVPTSEAFLDPYSSALSFPPFSARFRVPPGYKLLPVSPPTTVLLTKAWQSIGVISPLHCPGGRHFA